MSNDIHPNYHAEASAHRVANMGGPHAIAPQGTFTPSVHHPALDSALYPAPRLSPHPGLASSPSSHHYRFGANSKGG